MRIFWQSFVDETASAPYMEKLARDLNAIASPGTTVEVFGITPPDRAFSRLSELRCAILAIDNAIAAAESGYDAVVMGHFQDPSLYEMKSAVDIPVIGAGEVPQNLPQHRAEVDLFGGQQRIALRQIDAVELSER